MSRNRIKGLSLGLAVSGLSFAIAAPALADHVLTSDTQSTQTRPIELGTSGSSLEHLLIKGRLFCYTGTLGALVEDTSTNPPTRFILSNNHVLAKENEEFNLGSGLDDVIIQTGLLDEGPCRIDSGNPANEVARGVTYVPIAFGKGRNKPENTVDAAIAVADDSVVDTNGSILGIGTVNGHTTANVGDPVQKTGRTTAHTFGTVLATAVDLDVRYESGTARFVDQIRIRHVCDGDDYSAGGDSGSLITTVPATTEDPAAVGLLFAGGDADTFANPIATVLSDLNVTLVSYSGDDNSGAMLTDHAAAAADCSTDGGGGGGGGNGGGPGNGPGGPPFGVLDPLGLEIAAEVKARHSQALFALPDVVGHGVGADADGNAVIEVYVSGKARRAAMPQDIEGIAVRVVETGVIRAF